MSVIPQLATSLNRKDETPNEELAKLIAEQEDQTAVHELMTNVHQRNKNIQNDCIKVIYEIGVIKPALIKQYSNEFIALLEHSSNRLVWGAMTALDTITLEKPEVIYDSLYKIIETADKGSVITKDRVVSILIKLCSIESYAENVFPKFIDILKSCPTNQLPMYAENGISIINDSNKALFIQTLSSRLHEIEKDTKRKRVEKVIKKLN